MPEKQVSKAYEQATEWLETLSQKPSWRKAELPPEFTPHALDALDSHGYVEAEIMLPDCRIRWFSPRQRPLEAGSWEVICADKEVCGALSIRLTPVALRRLHDIELIGSKKGPTKPAAKRRKLPKRTTPTRRQQQALDLQARQFTFQQIGDDMGISKQAAERLVKDGLKNQRPSGRSVSTQALPYDQRGQVSV